MSTYRAPNPEKDRPFGEPAWLAELPPDLAALFRERDYTTGHPRWLAESTQGIVVLCLARVLQALAPTPAKEPPVARNTKPRRKPPAGDK